MDPIVSTIIAALASPIFLKIVEYVLNKNSEKAKSESAKLEALARRVDEYRDDKVKLEIKIGVLEVQLSVKEKQIADLQREASAFRYQLSQKDQQIADLQKEITGLQDSKQNK